MTGTEAKFPDVLEAVRAIAPGQDGPVTASSNLAAQVAKVLDLDFHASGYFRRVSWDKFTGQVSRALDKLAAQGALVKTGGRGTGVGVQFWAPEAWQRRQQENADREASFQADQDRKRDFRIRAGRLGILGSTWQSSRGRITMDLELAEGLLELAERQAGS